MTTIPVSKQEIEQRRQWVFLVLSGFFLGTLAMLNLLGITRFLDLSFDFFGTRIPFPVAVGVLPYPLTFLCTDLISEFYGKKRANQVVWVGLALNVWIVFILWIGGILPPTPELDPSTGLPFVGSPGRIFFEVRHLTFGAVTASMIAYATAQFCDVHLYHFWKRRTGGRHLWLRNNGSTLVSQLVDTVAVILITHYYAHALPIDTAQPIGSQLAIFIGSGYAFKLVAALVDTGPLYAAVHVLKRYLAIDPLEGPSE